MTIVRLFRLFIVALRAQVASIVSKFRRFPMFRFIPSSSGVTFEQAASTPGVYEDGSQRYLSIGGVLIPISASDPDGNFSFTGSAVVSSSSQYRRVDGQLSITIP